MPGGADGDFEIVPAAAVPSPCINVCTVDAAARVCRGCGRTLDEIAEWPAASDARKREILDAIAARR